MKKGDDNKVILPRSVGWQTSETYITTGVDDIPITTPIITLPTINCANKVDGSLRLENPMIVHEIIARKFTKIDVFLRPIFSDKKPDNGQPNGEATAVIDANHETCDDVKRTLESCKRSCDDIEGKPRPRPDAIIDKL